MAHSYIGSKAKISDIYTKIGVERSAAAAVEVVFVAAAIVAIIKRIIIF